MRTVQICVPWRSDGEPWREVAWNWCAARWMTLFPDWPLVVVDDGAESGSFNVATSLNRCVDESSADVLVMVGADTILRPGNVLEAVAFAEQGRWTMACDVMWRLDRLDSESVLALDPTAEMRNLGRRRVAQLGWGPIVAPRHVLLTRMWDERFSGGGEDDAFGLCAETLLGPPARCVRSPTWLLWHPSPGRAKHPDRDDCVALLHRYKCARWDQIAMHRLSREWQ